MDAALVRAVAVVSLATALLGVSPSSATAQINGGAGGAGGGAGGGGGGGFGGGTGGAGGGGGGAGGTGTGGAGNGDGGGGAGVGGGGGGGSVGGAGSGSIATFTNAGTITGGVGGVDGGGAGIGGGGGGVGGFGGGAAGFTIGDNTITNTGTITGGASSSRGGGAGIGRGGSAGTAGPGGAGLNGITIVNSGTIAGGNGGAIGVGGDAINGSSLTVTNNGGTLTRGTGGTPGSAIRFFGGTNRLTLNGGTITGDVRIDAGTLALTSTGANTITGALTLNAGTTYIVNVTPTGVGGSITTTGATTVAGSVDVRAANGVYAASTTYTILTANGGRTGTFSGVTVDKAFLTSSLSYSANAVFLTLQFSSTAFQGGARTPNQRAVGAALDAAAGSAGGDFGVVVSALLGLDTTQGPRALDTVSGQPYANLGTLDTQSGTTFLAGFATQAAAARGAAAASRGAGQRAALTGACAGGACDSPTARIGTWITGLGGGGAVPGDGNASGLNYNQGGVLAGADYRIDANFVVGLGLGFISSRLSTDSFAARATANSYTGAIYASFKQAGNQAGFHVDAVAGYALHDNRLVRTIAIPGLATREATGTPVAHQFYGQVEAGYTIPVDAFSLTPFVRLQGLTSRQSAFSESGANSLNLNVAVRTTNALRTVLGADITARADRVLLGMRLGWQHEFADVARPLTAAFAGAPASAFTVNGARPPRDHAVLGLWLDAKLAASTTAFVRYDGQLGGGAYNHAGSIGLRHTW